MKRLKQRYGCMEVWMDGKNKQQKDRDKSWRSGFTLVELVIVIAIVIILSVVSVPIYKGYTYKAKLAEAYALFGTIVSSEKSYYSEYGNFYIMGGTSTVNNYTAENPVLGVSTLGNRYFTWFRVGSSPEQGGAKNCFVARIVKPEDMRNKAGTSEIWLYYYLTEYETNFRDDAA